MQTVAENNTVAIVVFAVFLLVTVGITWWASRQITGLDDFLAAGRRITATQNGWALAGDFLSAATLLGTVGLVVLIGFDASLYALGGIAGWPILVFLYAERLRRLGTYTISDVIVRGRSEKPIRLALTLATLLILLGYMMGQIVGAGQLVQLMFGIPYEVAVCVVGLAMFGYVWFGGMVAATWTQIIKAVLLVTVASVILLLMLSHFEFSPLAVTAAAAERYGEGVLQPGPLSEKGVDALSLGLAALCGLLGMPHVLIRFYTVRDEAMARKSVVFATMLIGLFIMGALLLGYGALTLVGREQIVAFDRGGNVAALLLARVVGGDLMFGVLGAVVFATILAVVAGLTITASGAVSHDFWNCTIRNGKASEREKLLAARITTVLFAAVAIGLGLLMRGQNVVFLTALAFSIAGSANLPSLTLALFWPRLTSAGAVASILTGAIGSVALIWFSPTVQADIFHNPQDVLFPLRNPAIVTIPLSFVVAFAVSLLTAPPAKQGAQQMAI